MANRIMLNQTSYHGAGAIAEIVTEAKAHAFRKAFVCSDPDPIKFGVTGKVTGSAGQGKALLMKFIPDIKANPTIGQCEKRWLLSSHPAQTISSLSAAALHGYLQSHRHHHCQP